MTRRLDRLIWKKFIDVVDYAILSITCVTGILLLGTVGFFIPRRWLDAEAQRRVQTLLGSSPIPSLTCTDSQLNPDNEIQEDSQLLGVAEAHEEEQHVPQIELEDAHAPRGDQEIPLDLQYEEGLEGSSAELETSDIPQASSSGSSMAGTSTVSLKEIKPIRCSWCGTVRLNKEEDECCDGDIFFQR